MASVCRTLVKVTRSRSILTCIQFLVLLSNRWRTACSWRHPRRASANNCATDSLIGCCKTLWPMLPSRSTCQSSLEGNKKQKNRPQYSTKAAQHVGTKTTRAKISPKGVPCLASSPSLSLTHPHSPEDLAWLRHHALCDTGWLDFAPMAGG